jgi:hypothetical protein
MIKWSLLEFSMVHSSWCHFLARMCGMWKTIHLCCHIYSKAIVHLTFEVVRSLQYIVQCTIDGAICRNSHNIPHHFAMWLVVRTYHRERYFFALALGLALYHLPSNIVIRITEVFLLFFTGSCIGLCPADVSFLFSIDGMSMILLGRSLYMM